MDASFVRDSNNTDGCKSSDDRNQNQTIRTNITKRKRKTITASDVIKAKRQNLIMSVQQDIFDPHDLINNLTIVQFHLTFFMSLIICLTVIAGLFVVGFR